MKLRALRVYPVKSLRGYDVDSAAVLPWGLEHDRRWAVREPDGRLLTAREHPPMLRVTALPTEHGLILQAAGRPDLRVATPVAGGREETGRIGPTVSADAEAGRWLSETLGRPVVLVHQSDPRCDRAVKPSHGGGGGEPVNLADTAPLLLTAEASLSRLDELVGMTARERGEVRPQQLSMVRFRPNLVVDGEEPFGEDSWRQVHVGGVELRFAEHCDRCVLPTYDPETLVHTHEPTRTLARHRRWSRKVWFGIRLIPLTTGVLRVGDHVEVMDRASTTVGEAAP